MSNTNRKLNEVVKTDTDRDIYAYIDLGLAKKLAPFVLFDAVKAQTDQKEWGFGWHPHSGVATLTYIYAATLNHQDTSGSQGVIEEGGFQWMQAGGGIWHKEFYAPKNGVVGAHQLWVQLPPEAEEEPARYIDLKKEDIPVVDGKVKIISGSYKDQNVELDIPADLTYFDVSLKAGEEITLDLPSHQLRAIVYPRLGDLQIEGQELKQDEFGILEETEGKLVVKANADAQFIIAATVPSPYPLVHSRGQIHTNSAALERSKERIQDLGRNILK